MLTDQAVISAGFMPLLDASLLVVAREKGFAKEQGFELNLTRETSWATVRDRLTVGHFDVAHMLAPMPVAAAVGRGPMYGSMIAPMALGLGGNAVTVSNDLWAQMRTCGATDDGDASTNGYALREALLKRTAAGGRRPVFGVVHRFSSHNLELRYWLKGSGIDPASEAEFVIVPPSFMGDALQQGQIDGFCVGEPWNSVAVERGVGVIVTTKASIWRSSPEKVLAVRSQWADQNPDLLSALMRALVKAAEWCANPTRRKELAEILSGPAYLDLPADILMRGLTGDLLLQKGGAVQSIEDFLMFDERAATFPWVSHALWFYTQLVRWKEFPHSRTALRQARESYRPDLYRKALAGTRRAIPSASMKVEGALSEQTVVSMGESELSLGPDGFFDGQQFDPDVLETYLAMNK